MVEWIGLEEKEEESNPILKQLILVGVFVSFFIKI